MIGERLALAGLLLILLAAVGVVLVDDLDARLHAMAKASTFAMLLVLTGTAVSMTHADDISSAGGRIREIRPDSEREVDHRHVRFLESSEELSVRGSDRAQVVLASERPPGPGVDWIGLRTASR